MALARNERVNGVSSPRVQVNFCQQDQIDPKALRRQVSPLIGYLRNPDAGDSDADVAAGGLSVAGSDCSMLCGTNWASTPTYGQ